jgi:hypothetical protein
LAEGKKRNELNHQNSKVLYLGIRVLEMSHRGGRLEHLSTKLGSGVDPAKRSGPGFYGSTRINMEKLKNIYLKLYYFI